MCTPSSRATGFRPASASRVVSRRPSSRPRGGWCRWACRPRRGRGRRPGRSGRRSGPRPTPGAARCWDCEAERVGVGAGDAPLVGDALGALELRGHLVVAEVGLRDRARRGPSFFGDVRADRDAAHDLDAAGHGDVDDAGADERGGQVGGLLAGAALGVDGGGGDRRGRPAAEPRGAGDVEACSPTWLTQPPTTWPTSAGSMPVRSIDGPLDRGRAGRRGGRWTGRRPGARRACGRLRRSRRRSWPRAYG